VVLQKSRTEGDREGSRELGGCKVAVVAPAIGKESGGWGGGKARERSANARKIGFSSGYLLKKRERGRKEGGKKEQKRKVCLATCPDLKDTLAMPV